MADDDIRGLVESVQDYLVRGGLDEDARYILGPAYAPLSGIANVARYVLPGAADTVDMQQASADTMESLRNKDYMSAVGSAAMIPAAFAMMALPGTAGSVKEGVEEVIQPMYQSTVRDALDRISQETGTGQQMRAMLEKAGAKPREIEESGLSSLLKNPKVTKSEIAEAIPQNISEDIYQDARYVEVDEQIERLRNSLMNEGVENDPYLLQLKNPDDLTPDQRELASLQQEFDRITPDEYDQQVLGVTGPTNYREPEYTIRGGKNYREVVIKADPQKVSITSPTAQEVIPRIIDESANEYNVRQVNRDNPLMPEVTPRYGEHFHDTPNNVAHIRMDDRTTASGKNTVFVQEIQSDIHQLGRKAGYVTRDDVEKELGLIEEYSQKLKEMEKSIDKELLSALDEPLWKRGDIEADTNQKLRYIRMLRSEIMGRYNNIGNISRLMPDLPLKKNWYETSFRRALKDAIDSGADSLTWAPGQIHIDRYPGDPKRDAGLRKFYDQTLVKYANKLGKKYGTKVEEDALDIDKVKLSEAEELDIMEAQNEMSREDFQAMLRNLDRMTQKVWSLPITAEMREALGGKPVSTYKRGGSVVERSNKHEPKAI